MECTTIIETLVIVVDGMRHDHRAGRLTSYLPGSGDFRPAM